MTTHASRDGSPPALGGYFELELPPPGALPYRGAYEFQSARASFLALLRMNRPSRVWLPRYICDAMLVPLRTAGVPYAFYSLTRSFEVADADPAPSDWLLHVNYFGLNGEAQARTLAAFGGNRVVCDNAQALFAAPRACAATLWSPRKFLGVPDGGLLLTALSVESPVEVPIDPAPATTHLLLRLTGNPEPGYASFLAAEKALEDPEPRAMSPLTRRLLSTVDLARVATTRRANFVFLHERLGAGNRLESITQGHGEVPLCYPFLARRDGVREALAARRIYTAAYWPEVAGRSRLGSFEAELTARLVAVPCDQRYGPNELQRAVDALRELGT